MFVQILNKFPFRLHFRVTKCRVEANNNREAVVFAPHVVKQPGKRNALVVYAVVFA